MMYVLLFLAQFSFAQNVDLSQKLMLQEMFYSRYNSVALDLNDINRKSALEAWVTLANNTDPGYLKGQSGVFENLRTTIKNKSLINLAAHYNYVQNVKNARLALEFYYFELVSYIYEVAENPLLDKGYRTDAFNLVRSNLIQSISTYSNCLNSSLKPANDMMSKRQNLIQSHNSCLPTNLKQSVDFVRELLNDKYVVAAPSVVSHSGFITGNKVEQLTQNPIDPNTIKLIGQLNAKIKTSKPSGSTKTYPEMNSDDFKKLMTDRKTALDLFFTDKEGLPTDFNPGSAKFHPIYNGIVNSTGEVNMFGSLYNAISNAKSSIFIDVFFLGGSMGSFLAKKLISMVQQNPNLHVYVLTDRNNPLGYDDELRITYNYLKAYSEKFPEDRIYTLKPNITLKRTALPPYVDLLVDDQSLIDFLGSTPAQDIIKKLGGYPKAKSDHSKVFVIDGLLDTGVAFVGSKNLTDTSGAIATDELTRIEGPAVKLIMNAYYYDLVEAFRYSLKLSDADIRTALAPVDVIERYKGTNNYKITAAQKGSTVLQIGENNVYGTIRSAQVQDIQLILSAQNQIIISDQFLYDPLIVQALRAAIFKNSNLKVYVILAPLDDPYNSLKAFAHIPNNVFINDLVNNVSNSSRIQIKWKSLPDDRVQALKSTAQETKSALSPEYHLKAISVDGVEYNNRQLCGNFSNHKSVDRNMNASGLLSSMKNVPGLITGSANKDNMTMTGGFREFQVLVFDTKASAKHDCLFWSRWDDRSETEIAEANKFIIPAMLANKGITPEKFLEMVRAAITTGYNFVENYF